MRNRNLLLTACLVTLVAIPAGAQNLANTFPFWNGTQYISSFGVVDTATYGQTIYVFPGATPLTGFSVQIGNCGANVTFRGFVYAWDNVNSRATGPALWSGAPQTLVANPAFTLVTFTIPSLSLPTGNYVLFASTSMDQAGAPASACRWGSVNNAAYPGGQFVYINNGPDPALWTTSTWSTIAEDLAFSVAGLSSALPIPTFSPVGLAVLITALMAAGVAILARRH